MCFFASGKEDKTDTYNELCTKFANASDGKKMNFVFAEDESFVEDIDQADAIYFHGGNTRTLLKALANYKNLETYFENKTVAGSSAGAYMLVKLGSVHSEDCIREGLGILKVKLVCHFESPTMPPTTTSYEQLKLIAPELETIYLKDSEWRVIVQ